MTAAIIQQTPLRQAAARAGGINPLCRELGTTRQAYYDWQKQGGATPVYAILMSRLTGIPAQDLCSDRYAEQMALIRDWAKHL